MGSCLILAMLYKSVDAFPSSKQSACKEIGCHRFIAKLLALFDDLSFAQFRSSWVLFLHTVEHWRRKSMSNVSATTHKITYCPN